MNRYFAFFSDNFRLSTRYHQRLLLGLPLAAFLSQPSQLYASTADTSACTEMETDCMELTSSTAIGTTESAMVMATQSEKLWSDTVRGYTVNLYAGGNKYIISKTSYTNERISIGGDNFEIYTQLIGNYEDNIIHGYGSFRFTVDYHFKSGTYLHDDLIYGRAGNDTIYGHQGDDELYGENGNDSIYGGDGDDLIDGGSGNDLLYGESGDDVIIGGDGDDLLFGGDGMDQLYGGDGNDWLFSGNLMDNKGDVMTGGAGRDTFVLGEAPGPEIYTESMDWGQWGLDLGLNLANDVLDFSFAVFAPGWTLAKEAAPMTIDGVRAGLAINGSATVVIPPKEAAYAEITDFNPLEDVVIIPLSAEGKLDIFLSDDTNGENAITIKQDREGVVDIIATLSWADAAEIYGPETTYLDYDAKQAFLKVVLQNIMIIDASGARLGENSQIDLEVDPKHLLALGSNRFMIFGAYSGISLQGSMASEYLFGTNHDDIISGYKLDADGGTGFNPENSGNDELRGFAGNDIFFGGGGNDLIFGGDGSDTASYQDSIFGIVADLSNKYEDLNGSYALIVDDGFWGSRDKLYSVENIIGSRYDDIIIGDDQANALLGGGGNDQLTGGGGADVFAITTGGVATINDFTASQGDRIIIEFSGESLALYYEEVDGTGYLKSVYDDTTVVILQDIGSQSFSLDYVTIQTKDGFVLDVPNPILGTDGDDHLTGTAEDDVMISGAGNDILDGGDGADSYVLGGGNNTVYFNLDDGDKIYLSKKAYGINSSSDLGAVSRLSPEGPVVELWGNNNVVISTLVSESFPTLYDFESHMDEWLEVY